MLEFGLLLQSRGDPGAVEYFRKAALNKNPKGFAHLADVFEQGKLGIPKDFEEATKLRKFGTMLETQLASILVACCFVKQTIKQPQLQLAPEPEFTRAVLGLLHQAFCLHWHNVI
eukprot:g11024.t1